MRRVIIALLVASTLLACGGGSAKPSVATTTTTTAPDLQGPALQACYAEIKSKLKSPATAQFDLDGAPKVDVITATPGQEGFSFTGTVDSQNGFGALVRSDYVCSAIRSQKPPPEWLALVPKLTQR